MTQRATRSRRSWRCVMTAQGEGWRQMPMMVVRWCGGQVQRRPSDGRGHWPRWSRRRDPEPNRQELLNEKFAPWPRPASDLVLQ